MCVCVYIHTYMRWFPVSEQQIFIAHLICVEYYGFEDKENKDLVFIFLELLEELKSWKSYIVFPSLTSISNPS